jgi:hypothetical protein
MCQETQQVEVLAANGGKTILAAICRCASSQPTNSASPELFPDGRIFGQVTQKRPQKNPWPVIISGRKTIKYCKKVLKSCKKFSAKLF